MRTASLLRAGLWFLNLLYPKECVFCGASLRFDNPDYLCPACLASLARIRPPFCDRCGRPIFGAVRPPALCRRCRREPPLYDRARSAFAFAGAAHAFVLKFKYGASPHLARSAVRWMKEALDSSLSWGDYDRLIAVPLHHRKARERGFNQSLLLAAGLSRLCGIPLDRGRLRRARYTATQTRLDLSARGRNIRGAFRVFPPGRFRGCSLLLIDDVLTTGFTAGECARVLKADGARRVDVLTLARAV